MASVATGWAEVLQGEEVAYLGTEAAKTGRTEPFPDDLDPRVASALVAQGITALYRHQAEAWEATRAGENVIVTTGTASGKSLAFNLPVLGTVLLATAFGLERLRRRLVGGHRQIPAEGEA